MAAPASASPATFSFETPTSGGTSFSYAENGYTAAFYGVYAGVGKFSCDPACPDDGTSYLLTYGGALTITSDSHLPFSLSSFDGAESFTGFNDVWAKYIDAVGTKTDGSTVSHRYTLDFVQDGPGGQADFQTFASTDMTDLVSLILVGGGGVEDANFFSLDNISLTSTPAKLDPLAATVPEPTSLALIGVALLGAAGAGRKRRAA